MRAPLEGFEVDHLVYAVPDLEKAADEIEKALGMRPSPGGQHTGRGTYNALLGLGEGRYLEVIARDPEQPDPRGPRPFGIDQLEGPRLVTWAGRVPDIEAACAGLRDRGVDPGELRAMSRMRPDGLELHWRLSVPPPKAPLAASGVLPFLIDWGTTPKPPADLPSGLLLTRLELRHPEAAMLAALFGKSAPEGVSMAEGEARIEALLVGPGGVSMTLG